MNIHSSLPSEVSKQCSVNNGECSHICVMKADVRVCQCAAGYQLRRDKKTCEPTGDIKPQVRAQQSKRSALQLHKWKQMGTMLRHIMN